MLVAGLSAVGFIACGMVWNDRVCVTAATRIVPGCLGARAWVAAGPDGAPRRNDAHEPSARDCSDYYAALTSTEIVGQELAVNMTKALGGDRRAGGCTRFV